MVEVISHRVIENQKKKLNQYVTSLLNDSNLWRIKKMENENLSNIFQLYRDDKISRESFIGLIVCLLLDKNVFLKNSDVGEFISSTFDIDLPFYTLRSRTLMVSRVCRLLSSVDKKSLDGYSDKTYGFIKKFYFHQELNTTPSSKNKSTSNMNKWIQGILKKDVK